MAPDDVQHLWPDVHHAGQSGGLDHSRRIAQLNELTPRTRRACLLPGQSRQSRFPGEKTIMNKPAWRTQLRTNGRMLWWTLLLAMILAGAAQEAGTPRLALRGGELDAANCTAYESGRALAEVPAVAVLEGLLGIKTSAVTNGWSTPLLGGDALHGIRGGRRGRRAQAGRALSRRRE